MRKHIRKKNPGADSLITLAVLGLGAAAVLKASGTSNAGGSNSNSVGTRDATTDELSRLVEAGQASPTDRVQIHTESTPAGQTVSFATRNYDPGAPQRDQVIITADDLARRQGYYIPQLDEQRMQQLAAQYSGLGAAGWKTWLSQVASWSDQGGPWDYAKNEPLIKLTAKDWDYFRIMANGGGDKPLPDSQIGDPNALLSPEDYKNLVLTTPGGVLEGREVHYRGPASGVATAMKGLGHYSNHRGWTTF